MARATRAAIFEDFAARHGGEISASGLLKEVEKKGPAHPFYRLFEWDDTVAGQAHRLYQANELIRTFKMRIVITPEGPARTVRAYYPKSVTTGAGSSKTYTHVGRVLADPDQRERLRAALVKELEFIEQKYAKFDGLSAEFTKFAAKLRRQDAKAAKAA